jgi:hypothetical protein
MAKASSISMSFKIVESDAEIKRRVFKAIREEMNIILPKLVKGIRDDVGDRIIKQVFRNSDEYSALVNGPLDAHFGMTQHQAVNFLDAILNTLADSVQVEFKRVSVRAGGFSGGLKIFAIKSDFSDILALQEAHVVTNKGFDLPWLEWLLIEGDSIIISDYKIQFGNFIRSRSGSAIMLSDTSSSWRVPPGVSGTINNNWLTRMISRSIGFLEKAITASVKKQIERVT